MTVVVKLWDESRVVVKVEVFASALNASRFEAFSDHLTGDRVPKLRVAVEHDLGRSPVKNAGLIQVFEGTGLDVLTFIEAEEKAKKLAD